MATSPSTSDLHAAAGARLRAINSSYTSQRRALVEIFARAEHPLSINQLLAQNPRLAQSSAYRNLATLELAGVLHRIVTGDDFARFELSEAISGHHHHHLICSSCGSIEDMTLPPAVETAMTKELDKLAKKRGFSPTSHQMDLVGLCSDCA